MLFPLGDDNRQVTSTAYVTILLLIANLGVFFLLQQAGANTEFTYGWSVIPLEMTTGQDLVEDQTLTVEGQRVTIPEAPGPRPIYLAILSAMFMHGGYLHLGSNMLYLWIFGDNVEHRFGHARFLLFYLVSGIGATVAQVLLDPTSVVPNLGASGAISGVLGAYLVLFPRNRVHTLFFYFVVSLPAVVVIGFWIVIQFFNGLGAVMVTEETAGGVAYGAHVGGFVAGVVLALLLRLRTKRDPDAPRFRETGSDRSRRW